MRFNKIIGVSKNPKTQDIIKEAQEKLSSVFTELSLGYDSKNMGTKLGGDPFIFQLIYPLPHFCDISAIQYDEIVAKEKEIKERLDKGEDVPKEEHISDEVKRYRKQLGARALRTAATDGKHYYWNPEFVNKCSKIGLRIVVMHEACHSIFMHPSRCGTRKPKLWNIAVDYRVNFTIMEDLKARHIPNYAELFEKELGQYILLEELAAFYRDPFNPPEKLKHLNPIEELKRIADPNYKDPYAEVPAMFYADSNLPDLMKRPENVYDYLLSQVPKCPKCGKMGNYKKPQEYKDLEKKIKDNQKQAVQNNKQDGKNDPSANGQPNKQDGQGDQSSKDQQNSQSQNSQDQTGQQHQCDNHDHQKNDGDSSQCQSQDQSNNDGQPDNSGNPQNQPGNQPGDQGGSCCDEDNGGCGSGKCSECGGDDYANIDVSDIGDTLDDHLFSDISEEELAKRMHDAAEIAKKMGGKTPAGLEDELGNLSAPRLTWNDFLRQVITKKRNGYGKNDWTRPKTKPLMAGLYNPKKRDVFLNFLAAFDTSGSMSSEDIAFGISQLQAIDEKGEGYMLPFDTQPYYESMVKIKKANIDELRKAKVKGRGGTAVSDVFNTYEDKVGKMDVVIIITDSFLSDGELNEARIPKNTDVIWLVTSHNANFKPRFGRVFHLRNE